MKQSNQTSNSSALVEQLPASVLTRGGTRFDPREDLWHWTEGVFTVRLDFLKVAIPLHIRPSLKLTLVAFAKTGAPAYLINLFNAFKHFVDSRQDASPLSAIDITEVSNYSARLGQSQKWRLGTLNVVLQKWVLLGAPGVDPACATHLDERRKPGNIKGAAVRTRDPENGPFSEAEYTALYKAVDAAYGSGEVPRWLAVLTRLLFACGGRISQYASLKVLDLKLTNGQYVISLPQAKGRERNNRESFKDYDLSPQTIRLLLEHIAHLKELGFDTDSPLFPAKVVMKMGPVQDLRSPDDIFFGHCISSSLGKLLVKELKAIAPTTERLNFGPLPVNPTRFRYTFGTRLVEEGASKAVVADRLGQTDLQNVDVYYEASPKIVDNIDKAMDAQLAPLAAAFRGRLIKGEEQSTHKGAPGSRIIDFRVSAQPLASCAGKGQGCSFNKPVACYSCFKFEPWLDAPHEKVLARLEAEREKHAGDERIARVNDDAILAVRQVIAECALASAQTQEDDSEDAA